MAPKSTILAEAVAQGRKQLNLEQTEGQFLKLLCQIGDLENRNAALETGLKAISAKCYWRVMGYCNLQCDGRSFCDVSGLIGFDFDCIDLQAARSASREG